MKVLINAANLHVGGGVQVASSFISELYSMSPDKYVGLELVIYASDEVDNNIDSELRKTPSNIKYEILNIEGISKLSDDLKYKFSQFDLCFTIFGPNYNLGLSKIDLVGFAQPWIAYPRNHAYKKISILEQLRNRLKFHIQKLYFFKSDHLIVEQNDVKKALKEVGYSGDVTVVSNCISSIYGDSSKWNKIKDMPEKTKFTFGFVGRPYSHKNLDIIAIADSILKIKYNLDVDFVFTLSQDEFEKIGFSNYENFKTVGGISVSQCPYFYQYIDALIFPSLLECFSATPIEAMYMGKPVFASNLSFVKDICKDSVVYFDPLSAEDIAKKIYTHVTNQDSIKKNVISAKEIVSQLPTASDRAESYLSLIKKNIDKSYV